MIFQPWPVQCSISAHWNTLVVDVPTAAQNVAAGQATLLSWLAPAALGLDMTCHEDAVPAFDQRRLLVQGAAAADREALGGARAGNAGNVPVGDRRCRTFVQCAPSYRTTSGFEPERPTAKQNVGPLQVTPKSDADDAAARPHRRPW